MARLSIIIPTLNEAFWLPKLLQSIHGQTMQDWEVIVADAGSSDETVAIAKKFGALVVKGGLPGVGRNRGAEAASGTVFVFFDADVVLPHVHFLEDCLRGIEERGLDVATCRVRALEGTLIDQAMHGAYNAYTLATEHLLPHAPGFCLFAKRNVHEVIGGFDESVLFAEDMEYVRRADRRGYTFGILREPRIQVSVRRLEKEGRMRLAMKYMYGEMYMLAHGPFRQALPFQYEFGHVKDDDSDLIQTTRP